MPPRLVGPDGAFPIVSTLMAERPLQPCPRRRGRCRAHDPPKM